MEVRDVCGRAEAKHSLSVPARDAVWDAVLGTRHAT